MTQSTIIFFSIFKSFITNILRHLLHGANVRSGLPRIIVICLFLISAYLVLSSRLTLAVSDLIFSDSFESGNTSAWSAEVDSEADLNVTGVAALVGAQGLAATIDNTTTMYVRSDHPTAEPHYRARFYFDPNSVSMANGDVFTIFVGRHSGGSAFTVQLNNSTGTTTGYRLRTQIYNDGGSSNAGTYFGITDAPHFIEIDWLAATAAGANDGTITLWIDGIQYLTSPGVDNDTHRIEETRLGPAGGLDAGTLGTVYFDAFESRQTTYIGPVGASPTPIPSPAPTPGASPEPTPPLIGGPANPEEIPVKLMVVIYDPILENYGGVKLHEYFPSWNDPNVLTNQLVNDFSVFTHGTVKYEVVERIERDEYPLMSNGQRYNDDFIVQENSEGDWPFGETSAFTIQLNNSTGTPAGYRLRTQIFNDSGSATDGSYFAISDSPHIIEIDWQQATGAGANNGTISLWIDDTLRYTSPGIDNDQLRLQRVRLGRLRSSDTGTNGTAYFDAYEARRSTYIGPVNASPPPDPSDVFFTDGFETGDTSAWSREVDGENDLTVTSTAALIGAQGLAGLIDNATPMYVRIDRPYGVLEPRYRARFYFDPNSLPMAAGDTLSILLGTDHGNINYNAMISDHSIDQKVRDGKVDEVWLWGFPGIGGCESIMAGVGAYPINCSSEFGPPGGIVSGVDSKRFAVMGFNFERGMAEALESYGHRTENLVGRNYDGWHIFPGSAQILHDWDAFTAQDRWTPGLGGVGTAHDPFNAPFGIDYIRDSRVYASTSERDWYNFPDMTGDRLSENCDAWGCDGYLYLKWWYDHMPYMGGVKSSVLNNWWRYIADVEQYKNKHFFDNYRTVANDFAENNAADWSCAAEEATCTLSNETTRKIFGVSSIKFDTNGAFDTYVRYPASGGANWILSTSRLLFFSAYATNSNQPPFQGPVVVYLKDDQGNAFRYESPDGYMDNALNTWFQFEVPLAGDATWTKTTIGTPNLANIDQIEIHSDTWGDTFTIYFDGVGFSEDVDYAESNAASWTCWAQEATCTLTDDTVRYTQGASSVRFDTNGGFDTYVGYPLGAANWDLTGKALVFWAYSENPSPNDFQNNSPWIKLIDTDGNSFRYQTDRNAMNLSIGRWKKFTVPLWGDSVWKRTQDGASLSDIDQVQIHIDTWDNGFTTNIDGFHFESLDMASPTVEIVSPASNSPVSGIVPVTINASDNNVINRVDLFVDNAYIGTDAVTPFTIFWNSSSGSHTLRAKAVDFAGNETISSAVTVNPAPSFPTPTPTPLPTPVATPTPTPIPSPSPGGEVIFEDGFESGNTSAWSGETDTEGDLNVTTAASLDGSYGLSALYDNNTAMYLTDNSPAGESRYLANFSFDPNSITMASGDTQNILIGRTGSGQAVFTVQFNNNTGNSSGYRIRVQIYTDGGSAVNGTYYPISDAPHQIAIDWQAATAAGANNGAISLSIDGVLKQTKSAVDNDTRRVEEVPFGPAAGIDTGTRGTVFFDSFRSQRSGGGQPSATPTPVPTPLPTPGTSPVPTPPSSPAPSPSDTIFSDSFESGNTSAWSAEVDGEADLNVTPGAALVGSQGLAVLVDNSTLMYLRDDSPVAEPRYRARFYFDPNSITMASGDVHTILQGRSGSTVVFTIQLNNNTGTTAGYRIRTQIYNDAGSTTAGTYFGITDAPHFVEIDWQAATAAGANNGTITLWIDGVQKYISPGIDNDTRRVEEVRFGPLAGIDIGTSGTYYLDAFESRRSTYIGP